MLMVVMVVTTLADDLIDDVIGQLFERNTALVALLVVRP